MFSIAVKATRYMTNMAFLLAKNDDDRLFFQQTSSLKSFLSA